MGPHLTRRRWTETTATQELVGSPLAPKNEETLRELLERRPQVATREIPREVLDFSPPAPLELNFKLFSNCLRSAPAGSSPGPGGCTNEMLKVCLDDQETLQLLFCAADEFARGDVPRGVGHCFTLATLTALQKDGGVRGIATGTTFRRSKSASRSKQRVLHSSSRCPLGLESTAWGTQYES